jgi:hypothetical protein
LEGGLAIVRVDAHNCLVLPTETPMGKRDCWVEVSRLSVPFAPVVKRIKLLAGRGLTLMMVLFNFLSRRIAPLQMHVRPTWQCTGEGDTTRLERGLGSGLSPDVLSALLGKLTPDPSSAPVCSDQPTRLLRELPTMDDIGVTVQQKDNESRGVQIPETDIAGG